MHQLGFKLRNLCESELARRQHMLETLGAVLLEGCIKEAATFYEHVAPEDFCISHLDDRGALFGCANKISWTPRDGFQIVKASEKFLNNFKIKKEM